MRTHYDNLRVKQNAEPEVIRAAYRALANKWHPDKVPASKKAKAERYMKIINGAFEVLSDPHRRKEHDEQINLQSKPDAEKQSRAITPPVEQFCTACLEHHSLVDKWVDNFFNIKTIFSYVFLILLILFTAWNAWNGDKISVLVLALFALTWFLAIPVIAWSMRPSNKEGGMPTTPDKPMASRY